MKQNIKISIFATILLCSTVAWAQIDDTENQVMQKITEALSQGDCDRAQRNYNIWKDLTQTTDSTVEGKIKFCVEAKNPRYIAKRKTLSTTTSVDAKSKTALQIGQKHKISVIGNDGKLYSCEGRIAYLDASGEHGLLLTEERKNASTYHRTDRYYKRFPTKGELELIYKNKSILGLFDEYWSSTVAKHVANWYFYYTMDFASGKFNKRSYDKEYYYLLVADF
jgi:hypothetical protein